MGEWIWKGDVTFHVMECIKKIARHLLMSDVHPIISQKGRRLFHPRIKEKVAAIVPMEIIVSK